jgi:hypothetical protein
VDRMSRFICEITEQHFLAVCTYSTYIRTYDALYIHTYCTVCLQLQCSIMNYDHGPHDPRWIKMRLAEMAELD